MQSSELPQWVTVLSAALTPVTACLAVFVAVRQYLVQRHQTRLQLYERRMKVYAAYRELLVLVSQSTRLHSTPLHELRSQLMEAEFLFNPTDADAIEEARVRSLVAERTAAALAGARTWEADVLGMSRADLIKEDGELRNWSWRQVEASHDRFAKYFRAPF